MLCVTTTNDGYPCQKNVKVEGQKCWVHEESVRSILDGLHYFFLLCTYMRIAQENELNRRMNLLLQKSGPWAASPEFDGL